MENYEQIISDIESEMNKKCDEPRVREIVKEELELYPFHCYFSIPI
jgi:hypothetical protein